MSEQQLVHAQQQIKAAQSLIELAQFEADFLPQATVDQQVDLLSMIGRVRFQLGDFDLAVVTFEQALQLAKEHQLAFQEASVTKSLGALNYFSGKNHAAISFYIRATALFQQLNEPLQIAHLNSNLGLAYGDLAYYDEALTHLFEAQKGYQEFGTEQDLVDMHTNIGNIYNRLSDFHRSVELFQLALAGYHRLADDEGIAIVDGDIGIAYRHIGQLDLSFFHLKRSLAYYEKQQDEYHMAAQLHNLSELFALKGENDKALQFALKANLLGAKINNTRILKDTGLTLTNFYIAANEVQTAKGYLEQVKSLAEKEEDGNTERMALMYEALLLAMGGEGAKSIQQIEQHHNALKRYITEIRAQELTRVEEKLKNNALSQELLLLKEQQAHHDITVKQARLEQYMAFLILLIVLVIVLVGYRRNLEKKSKQRLFELVEQRTQELTETTAKLKQAAAFKDQFLANMSHEIRTPLTAVLGQAEAIINDEIPEQSVKHEVGIIHKNGEHLLALLNDILDISKIEEGKLEIEKAPVLIKLLLLELENMFVEQAHSKNLDFIIDAPKDRDLAVATDGFRIKQILINLCANAIKFTEHGFVKLSVSYDQNRLYFAVQDTGIGIAEEKLQSVFQAFKQADSSISRRFGGTGLGLSLSQKLAQHLDGAIELSSTLNEGSTFTLSIPYQAALSEAVDPQHSHTELPQHYQGTVLVAEDHADNRRLIKRLLEGFGVSVLLAENGVEAAHLAYMHKPDLVLMDIQMPLRDGMMARKDIQLTVPDLPVVALTANAMRHEVEQYLAMGFCAYLAKPIDRQALCQVLSEFLPINEPQLGFMHGIDDLMEKFKSSWEAELELLNQHVLANDLVALQSWAHKLAGAAAMFDCASLAQHCSTLERKLKQNDTLIEPNITQLRTILAD